MRVLRRGADVDDADVSVRDDVAVVEGRGRGIGERLALGEAVGADFADVQLLAQRRARQRFGADAAAPAGPDHRGFEELYQRLSFFARQSTSSFRGARLRANPESRLWEVGDDADWIPGSPLARGPGMTGGYNHDCPAMKRAGPEGPAQSQQN